MWEIPSETPDDSSELQGKMYNLYICNIIHKIYVIGNIPPSVSHIGVSHMMYEFLTTVIMAVV
jgi:hypothetical protein